jgi:hypothetical protein
MKLICWLRETWRTVMAGLPVSGHDFVEVYDDGHVQVLKCQTCGHVSRGYR